MQGKSPSEGGTRVTGVGEVGGGGGGELTSVSAIMGRTEAL